MTFKYSTRIFWVILIIIVGNMFLSTAQEIENWRDKRDNIALGTKLAVESALKVQQTSGSDTYSIKNDITLIPSLESYIDSVKTQAQHLNINTSNSDLPNVMQFLSKQLTTYKNTGKGLYTPLQFSMTFLDKHQFKQDIREYMLKYIETNYGVDNGNTAALSRAVDSLILEDAVITVSNPRLVYLSNTDSEFAKLFGSARSEALNIAMGSNRNDKRFNYVIQYDVSVTVKWKHVTSTPFYKFDPNVSAFLELFVDPGYLSDNYQLIWPGEPYTINRTFTLIN